MAGLLDLIPNLGGLGQIQPRNQVKAAQGFRTDVVIADGDAAYDTQAEVIALKGAAGAGYFTIWEMTVPAQQMVHWGYGSPAAPQNQGYMWFALVDAGTGFDAGKLRLIQRNARDTKRITVAEIDDSSLHSVTNTSIATAALINKDEMFALPEKIEYPLVQEDSVIALSYSLITATTTVDQTGFKIPLTVYQ